jgi:hypothetical protein
MTDVSDGTGPDDSDDTGPDDSGPDDSDGTGHDDSALKKPPVEPTAEGARTARSAGKGRSPCFNGLRTIAVAVIHKRPPLCLKDWSPMPDARSGRDEATAGDRRGWRR